MYVGARAFGQVAGKRTLQTAGEATQAQMEATTAADVFVSPANTRFHPGVAKAWVHFGVSGDVLASHNITTVTKNGTGDWTAFMTVANSSANYAFALSRFGTVGMRVNMFDVIAMTASTLRVSAYNVGSGAADVSGISQLSIVIFGDQA